MLDTLTEDERDFVDELLLADYWLWTVHFVWEVSRCRLLDAGDAVDTRKTALGIDFSGHARARVSAFDSLTRLQQTLTEEVCVIEGSWDGDSLGWFVRLSAITAQPSARHPRFTDHGLCVVRGFRGQVEYAAALGEELARMVGTTFYFTDPAPDFATFDYEKRWWDTQEKP